MIWKPRWDNGAVQAGYSGQAGCNVLWRDVVGAGGEGEVIEAVGFSRSSQSKKNVCSC